MDRPTKPFAASIKIEPFVFDDRSDDEVLEFYDQEFVGFAAKMRPQFERWMRGEDLSLCEKCGSAECFRVGGSRPWCGPANGQTEQTGEHDGSQ